MMYLLLIPAAIAIVLGVLWLQVTILVWAWGLLAPVFGMPLITFWQGAALMVVLNFIGGCFKTFVQPKGN